MSTQIKRLKQNGAEFVPITLAEAVVVKTDKLPLIKDVDSIPDITTLDRILSAILGLDNNTLEGLNQLNDAVKLINETLANKQDTLKAGTNITISSDGTISSTYSYELYEVVTTLPENAQPNKIYLAPNENGVYGNVLNEFVWVKNPTGEDYHWEMLGTIQTETDLSGYVTKDDFNKLAATTITAEDVKTSSAAGSLKVEVVYDIPADLYDSVIVSDSNDLNGDYIG